MEVICLEEAAFYQLVEDVVSRLGAKQKDEESSKWLSPEDAMKLLNVTSTSTLQKLRDQGSIRFSQPMQRVILYDRDSILAYLDKHAKDTF